MDEDAAIRTRIAAELEIFFESLDRSDEDSESEPPPEASTRLSAASITSGRTIKRGLTHVIRGVSCRGGLDHHRGARDDKWPNGA